MSRPPSEPRVPTSLVNRRKADWHVFTRGMVWNCVAVAAVLLFLLLVFRIL
jgi:hypothetical protein